MLGKVIGRRHWDFSLIAALVQSNHWLPVAMPACMPKKIADMAFKEAKDECLPRLERLVEVRRNEIAEAERAEARYKGL